MLYRKRKPLVKECILLSLRIAVTVIKIKAKTITEIATEITETLAVIEYIDNQILTADLRDIATSVRRRIVIYRDIQRRNVMRLRRSIKAALVIKLKDSLITALRNALSNILLTTKKTIVRTQRTLMRFLKPLL